MLSVFAQNYDCLITCLFRKVFMACSDNQITCSLYESPYFRHLRSLFMVFILWDSPYHLHLTQSSIHPIPLSHFAFAQYAYVLNGRLGLTVLTQQAQTCLPRHSSFAPLLHAPTVQATSITIACAGRSLHWVGAGARGWRMLLKAPARS